MAISSWNAGIIRPIAVAPAGPYQDGTASGIWTLEEAAFWNKQGLWPDANNTSPNRYIENIFSTYLYTGNGSTQTITNGINLSGNGGLVWMKNRSVNSSYTESHGLFDTIRGAYYGLNTDGTAASTNYADMGVSAFSTTGFSTKNRANPGAGWNNIDITYASWTFRKQPKFFDIVTYTGNDTTQNIAHSLGSTPGCVIIKRTDATASWYVWHRGCSAGYYAILNTTAAQTNTSSEITFGNNTTYVDPTSTQFTIGSNGNINGLGNSYVAYIFAHNAGGFGLTGTDNVISCGSYTGGTFDGVNYAAVTTTLGFEPQWVLVKETTGTNAWFIFDNMRGIATGGVDPRLSPNSTNQEFSANWIDLTSTGFTATVSDGSSGINNGSSNTYIYIAIRRGPMKVPTTGTSVFTPATRSATGAVATVTGVGFPPDLYFSQPRQSNRNPVLTDRLRGATKSLSSRGPYAEQTETGSVTAFGQDGVTLGANNADFFNGVNDTGFTFANWNFRRAPGFFDIVCYTGTGSVQNITHNLRVAPEFIIVKDRTNGQYWISQVAPIGPTFGLALNYTDAAFASTSYWNNTSPTSSVFTIGTSNLVNYSGDNYVSYLFATCAGVSKVGSYTGTGTTLQVNCGFTAGARFVLIKRTDSTGDWYVWDTARGIISGNDPYLLMNSTAAEVTNTDYIDPYSAGFELSSTAPAAINENGGTYIFLAIA